MRIDNFYGAGRHPQPIFYKSTAQEAAVQVKTSGGILRRIAGYTSNVAGQFLQVHNSASTPAEGAVPVYSVAIAGTWSFDERDLEGISAHLTTGIYVCVSTTQPTKTLGTTDTWFNIEAL